MKKLQESVYMFESSKAVRCYFLMADSHNIIIDTGFPGKAMRILKELEQLGIAANEVTDILITHNDIDHTGNASLLQQATRAKVWMHKNDLTNDQAANKRPRIKRLLGVFINATGIKIDQVINGSEEIIPGIQAVETPGHTPGHTAYVWKDVMFIGDAATVTKKGHLKLSPSFFNADQQLSEASLKRIQQLPFALLCPGHGAPYFTNSDKKSTT